MEELEDGDGRRRVRLHAPGIHLEFDDVVPAAEGALTEAFWATPPLIQRDFFLLTFVLLLEPRGHSALHANSVSRDGRDALVVGASGAGKTTTTLALLRAGWSCLGDDALTLTSDGGAITAHALRRRGSLTETSLRALEPESAEASTSGDWVAGKLWVDLERAFPGRLALRSEPSRLLFPQIVDARHSELRSLSKAAAMTRLLEQSPGILRSRQGAKVRLELLRDLVQQAPAFELRAGSDVLDRPAALGALLERLW